MTTKIQHSASSFDFDTVSADALETCTGGDGTNDAQRGYGPMFGGPMTTTIYTPSPPPPSALLTPPGWCPEGTGMTTTEGHLPDGTYYKKSSCEFPRPR